MYTYNVLFCAFSFRSFIVDPYVQDLLNLSRIADFHFPNNCTIILCFQLYYYYIKSILTPNNTKHSCCWIYIFMYITNIDKSKSFLCYISKVLLKQLSGDLLDFKIAQIVCTFISNVLLNVMYTTIYSTYNLNT